MNACISPLSIKYLPVPEIILIVPSLGWSGESINDKHRFTLHWTSRCSESMTTKVT